MAITNPDLGSATSPQRNHVVGLGLRSAVSLTLHMKMRASRLSLTLSQQHGYLEVRSRTKNYLTLLMKVLSY